MQGSHHPGRHIPESHAEAGCPRRGLDVRAQDQALVLNLVKNRLGEIQRKGRKLLHLSHHDQKLKRAGPLAVPGFQRDVARIDGYSCFVTVLHRIEMHAKADAGQFDGIGDRIGEGGADVRTSRVCMRTPLVISTAISVLSFPDPSSIRQPPQSDAGRVARVASRVRGRSILETAVGDSTYWTSSFVFIDILALFPRF